MSNASLLNDSSRLMISTGLISYLAIGSFIKLIPSAHKWKPLSKMIEEDISSISATIDRAFILAHNSGFPFQIRVVYMDFLNFRLLTAMMNNHSCDMSTVTVKQVLRQIGKRCLFLLLKFVEEADLLSTVRQQRWRSWNELDTSRWPFLDSLENHVADDFWLSDSFGMGDLSRKLDECDSSLTSNLPESLSVVCVYYDLERNHIHLFTLDKFTEESYVRIPLLRGGREDTDTDNYSYSAVLTEFQNIISDSDRSLINNITPDAKDLCKAWWNERTNLDGRLQDLLRTVERFWFGGFRVLIVCKQN